MKRIAAAFVAIAVAVLFISLMTTAIHRYATSRVAFGTDSYVYWLAGRAVFLDRASPYSPEISEQAQRGIYGRLARPGEDHMAFVNPPFSLVFFLPGVWMSYPLAQAFWISTSIAALLGAVWLAFPGLPGWVWGTVVFLYPVSRGIIMGQLSPILGAAVVLIYGLMFRNKANPRWAPALAGFLLAWLFVKPQLTWLMVVFFLGAALRDRKVAVWAGLGLGLLFVSALSWWMVPAWPQEWLAQAASHAQNRILRPGVFLWMSWIGDAPILKVLAGLITVIALTATVYSGLRWWRGRADAVPILAVLALATLILDPLYLPPEQIILLLPLLVWADRESQKGSAALYIVWGCALLLPWLIFLLSFRGAEPYAVSIWPPLLFALWILWIRSTSRRDAEPVDT